MSTTYEIPLTPSPQTFSILLAGVSYQLTLRYIDATEGGWLIDIADNAENNILCGVPLVTGHDLLEQYDYLGLGGQLFVQTDGDPDAIPTFQNLGLQGHLYFVTP
jgi:predicted Zn-dependent protease with MMP-like domain